MNKQEIAAADGIPIIRLWGNLLVPLQGDVTDTQAERLSEVLLQRIHESDVSGLVIDVCGVSVIDSHLCGLLARLAAAAGLMGVRSVLCGLSPEVVMTLQAMAIDLGGVETALSLEAALERLGFRQPLGRSAGLPAQGFAHDLPDALRERTGNNQE